MAFPIGKLTIIIGAGLVGNYLTNGGHLSNVTSLFSGTLKIFSKHLQRGKDSPQSSGKSQNDSLLTQVSILREQLKILATSRSDIIVTGISSGSGTYGVTVVVVVGVMGYVYIWWKGCKLSDLMFVTRRGFSSSCTEVAKQVDLVSLSISSARRHLSSRIDCVNNNLNECVELTVATKGEVLKLHGEVNGFHLDVESVQRAVETLETQLDRIEESQDLANQGVYSICKYVRGLEQCGNLDQIQGLQSSSRPALELPQAMPITRAESLPPLSPSSASSSSSTETPKVLRPMTLSASALKELQGVSHSIKASVSGPSTPRAVAAPEIPIGIPSFQDPTTSSSLSSGLLGWKMPSMSFLTRSRSTAT